MPILHKIQNYSFFPTHKRSSTKTRKIIVNTNPNKIKKHFCFSEKKHYICIT